MLFKDISYVELWQPFCSVVEGVMRNNSVKLFCIRRRCLLKILSGALAALLFGGGTIYAILKEGIIGNI